MLRELLLLWCGVTITSPGLDHSSWKNLIKTNKNWKPTQVMKQHETSLRGRQTGRLVSLQLTTLASIKTPTK